MECSFVRATVTLLAATGLLALPAAPSVSGASSRTIRPVDAVLKNVAGTVSRKLKSYTYSVTMGEPEFEAEPEPETEPDFTLFRGPAVLPTSSSLDVSANLPCQYTLSDDDGYLADLTAQPTLWGPSDTQIASSEPNWVYQKSSISSSRTWTLTDPPEGTYKCRVYFWYYTEPIGYGEDQKQVSYLVPTGESNAVGSWSGPALTFNVTLTGGTFNGRQVAEFDGPGGSFDECYYLGSTHDPFNHVTGSGTWGTVSSNGYGDVLSWAATDITYYRAQGKTPCKTTLFQDMKINKPGTSPVVYITNRLELGINNSTVWNKRATVRSDDHGY